MAKRRTAEEKQWLMGYIAGLAMLHHAHGETTPVGEVLTLAGITVGVARRLGCCEHDMAAVRKCLGPLGYTPRSKRRSAT